MKRYYENSSHNKAAMILASMAPDMIDDIVSLATAKGSALKGEIERNLDGPSRPLGIFSREFIADEDFPEVFIGFTTVQLAEMKKLNKSGEWYSTVLEAAYSMPSTMAMAIGNKIDTEDLVGRDYEGKQGWIDNIKARVVEFAREAANWGAARLGLNWFWDQNQKYDLDYLYELSLLGREVLELNKRARLMSGQAIISKNLNLFQAGDVETDSATVLDKYRPSMTRKVPEAFYGGHKKMLNNMVEAQNSVLNDPSYGDITGPYGDVQQIDKADALVFALRQYGVPSGLLSLVKNITGGDDTGKALTDTHAAVAETYGPDVAESWASGDIGDIIDAASDLDNAADITRLAMGDVDDQDFETGGIFSGKKNRSNRTNLAGANSIIMNKMQTQLAKQQASGADARMKAATLAKARKTAAEIQRRKRAEELRQAAEDAYQTELDELNYQNTLGEMSTGGDDDFESADTVNAPFPEES